MPSFPSLTAPLNTSQIGGQQSGLTPFATVHASSVGAAVIQVQTGPCQLFGVSLGNTNGQFCYFKCFDLVASPLTLVSGAAVSNVSGASAVASFLVPGNAAGAGSNVAVNGLPGSVGVQFFNGLAIAVTANPALADQSGVSGGVTSNVWVR